MDTLEHPDRTVFLAVLFLWWLASAAPLTEASCRAIDPSCQGRAIVSETVAALQSPQDWDGPWRFIYQGYLAPIFASCDCSFFGVEEVQSWNDPDESDLHWWLVNVVVGVSAQEGWQIRTREYLFNAKGTASPVPVSLSAEQSWPADVELVQ
ncbi:MAG: hypothetical protein FJ246_12325 [Nitrospira sp.]|nr:hypothetical protein [Nitrospira sp.]